MRRRIYLIRHAESDANVGVVNTEPAAIPLTRHGRDQALALAQALSVPPLCVLSSPYLRAFETAQIVCAHFAITPTKLDLLHEFNTLAADSWIGTTFEHRKSLVDRYWAACNPHHSAGVGAESFIEFVGRVQQFLSRLERLDDATYIFGHGNWLAMLMWQLRNPSVQIDKASMTEFRAFQMALPIANCAVYEFERRVGGWSVELSTQAAPG